MDRLAWIVLGVSLCGWSCGYPEFKYRCELVPQKGCKSGERCTIADTKTGETGCVKLPESPVEVYGVCSADSECGAGMWCDVLTSVCKPLCATDADCGGGGCLDGWDAAGDKIPGLMICAADCAPMLVSCPEGATCEWDIRDAIFDCYASGGKDEGEACKEQRECEPTLVCAVSECRKWCQSTSDCPAGHSCVPFDSYEPIHDDKMYWFCW